MTVPRTRTAVVALLLVGLLCCCGCAARPGRDGQGGAGAFVAGMLISRRAGYELNEGHDVSFAEGLRMVPYVNYIPMIVQGLAAASGRTSYEALYENGLLAATYGGFSLDALTAAQEGGVVSDADLQKFGGLLAQGSHLNFATISRAHQLKLIGDAERTARIRELVKPRGRLTDVALDLNPENRGLYSAAHELGTLTAEDLRRLMMKRLRRPDLLSTELAVVAHKAGVIDDAARKACLEYVLCRVQARILTEAQRAGTAPPDASARRAQAKARGSELRKVLKDHARRL